MNNQAMRELVAKWRNEVAMCPEHAPGIAAAAAVSLCANELEAAALATPEQASLSQATELLCDAVRKFLNEEGQEGHTTRRCALRVALVRAARELALAQAAAEKRAATAAEAGTPWLYAIEERSKDGRWSWHDGEQCVFGDKSSAQDELDALNDGEPEDDLPYRLVPLYRAAGQAAKGAAAPQQEKP